MASTGQINQKLYEFCLKYAPDFSSDLTKKEANPALLIAPYLKDTSLLSFFSKNKASISALDNQGNNAFVYAARTGNIQIMEWLISQNIGPNKQSGTAMIFAAQGTRSSKNNIKVFKFLIKNGVALDYQNEQGNTAFHFVSTYGNQELIQFFLTNGANINQANKKGVTPFMQSMNNSSLEVLKLMLEHKPLIDQKDQDGNNVLSYLVKGFHEKDSILFNNKIALLKTAQLDVSTTQKDDNNLFHLAVEKNSNYLVRLANQYQLAINFANKNGLTPLHLACNLSDDIDLIQLLISFKSDTQIKTSFGETAFELANENELLKEQNLEFLK
jgi:ankyrin repeat protein